MDLIVNKPKLSVFQKDIIKECLKKEYGGISLSMGSGKTICSLILALKQTSNTKNTDNKQILIIMSKTLLESWVHEIKKFFGDTLKYIILHSNNIKNLDTYKIDPNIKIILTTPEVVSHYYKKDTIANLFIHQEIKNQGLFNQHNVTVYNKQNVPYHHSNLIYSVKWGCLIIDEVQKFTKISSIRCQSIGAICAKYRWALSGTMFDEPSIERILGYYIIINHPTFPRILSDAEGFIKSNAFKGFNETIVLRKTNPSFIIPRINEQIITNKLSNEEEKLYLSMKNTMKIINENIKKYKKQGDIDNQRRFSSYLLAIICYLRQCIVCPLLPIANVAIDMTDFENNSDLSKILNNEIGKLNINEYLNNKESIKSNRIKSVLNIINKHPNENLVVFTCFRTCLDVLKHCIVNENDDRNIYTLTSNMNVKKRGEIISQFANNIDNKKNILLLTYELGAEGLNLQSSNTVLLVDFAWNDGKTQQAIARVLRFGQKSNVVNVYLFTSNTGIEKAMFIKHSEKLSVLNELSVGQAKTKVKNINVKAIITIIEHNDNIKAINDIKVKNI